MPTRKKIVFDFIDDQELLNVDFDRMERGIISEDDFVSRRAVLEARIDEAQKALDSLPADDGDCEPEH